MRKFWIAILIVCLGLPGIYGGYRGYRHWRQKSAIKQALQFINEKDYNNAMLFVRQVLDINPSNIQANKLMADFCEAARSPNALIWRSRLVDLQPDSAANKLNLARTALVFNDPFAARKALDAINEKQWQNADYHKIAGAIATMRNSPDEAEKHLFAALSMEPNNVVIQVNLAASRLRRTDTIIGNQARATLLRLTTNSVVKLDALRQLTADAVRQNQPAIALEFIRQILQDTNSTFSDRLIELEVLHSQKDPQVNAKLITLQKDSMDRLNRACEVAKWMFSHSEASAALVWIKTLPPGFRTNLPMPMVMADCYMATKDWLGLQNELANQNWAELDCLRLIYRARALRSQSLDGPSKIEFANAMKAADAHLERLKLMLEATSHWDWPAETEVILWKIVNRFPGEKWAVPALNELLYKAGKTRSLKILFSRMAEMEPTNQAIKNNLAMVALLLDAREKQPHELAREVYEHEKDNPNFIFTYAFSLYLQKKNVEALSLMERIKPDQLESPSTAGYYGLVLAATGNQAKAKIYLELAAKAKQLPEETALFRKAMPN